MLDESKNHVFLCVDNAMKHLTPLMNFIGLLWFLSNFHGERLRGKITKKIDFPYYFDFIVFEQASTFLNQFEIKCF